MIWQPIETAPLKTDRFDGLHTEDSVLVSDGIRVGEAYCKYGKWRWISDPYGDDERCLVTPTSWMPLPAPPGVP